MTKTMTKKMKSTSTSKSKSKQLKKKYLIALQQQLQQHKLFKELSDSFNFKGYGLSFNKSFLHRQACGIVFRLPLTSHFDFFEMRPWLPIFTSTFGLYFPSLFAFLFPLHVLQLRQHEHQHERQHEHQRQNQHQHQRLPVSMSMLMPRGTFSINASLPVALLKYVLLTLWDQIQFGFTLIWYFISKTIVVDILGILILSNVGKILGFGSKTSSGSGSGNGIDNEDGNEDGEQGKIRYDAQGEPIDSSNNSNNNNNNNNNNFVASSLKLFKDYPQAPTKRKIQYSTRISDRVGISITFIWQFDTAEENGGSGTRLLLPTRPKVKCTWFHSYLPTMEHIGDVTTQNVNAVMNHPFVMKLRNDDPTNTQTQTSKPKPKQKPKPKPKKTRDVSKEVKEWLRQKVGSLGVTWGGFFTSEPPFYSCSATLSLSGFYYGGQSLKKLYEYAAAGASTCTAVPQKIFSSAVGGIVTPVSKSKSRSMTTGTATATTTTTKVDRNKREKHLKDILQESDDLECEIIDVKVKAS
mmetsp:Transcript_25105/g.37555  ORF Transcript_25105/g.37555 Transcript_25105/m.37555 type:complete len:522 (-) Transcript_25105:938-2503(-)